MNLMLDHFKRNWPWWIFAILAAMIFLCIVASNDLRQCMNHRFFESAEREPPKGFAQFFQTLLLIGNCSGSFLKENGEAITAAFTIVLSISTILLWRSTDKLWETGERQHRMTERAFVYLDGLRSEVSTAREDTLALTRFAVQPRWKNSGNTPTRNMIISVNWRPPNGDLPLDFSYPFTNPPEPFFLGPKAIEHSGVFEMPGASALIRDGAGQGGDGLGPRMFVWGRADYHDTFGDRHFIQWCYLVRFERHDGENLRAHFIQWGDYNRSDEDD